MQLWDSWWLEFLELLILPVACGWGLLRLSKWADRRNTQLRDEFVRAHPDRDAGEWMHSLTRRSLQGFLFGSLGGFESNAIRALAVLVILAVAGTLGWILLMIATA
jgi:hypothetical protein